MKRIIIVAVLSLVGCCKQEPCTAVTVIQGIRVNKSTLLAMQFCQDEGKSFKEFSEYDFLSIGRGIQYSITCEEKK